MFMKHTMWKFTQLRKFGDSFPISENFANFVYLQQIKENLPFKVSFFLFLFFFFGSGLVIHFQT